MMLLAIQVLAVWLCGGTLLLLFRHGPALRSLWGEPVLNRPVVIVESDDWGVGPQQDAEALAELARLLGDIRDGAGGPAVMTLGVVLGKPDGDFILSSGLAAYRRSTLLEPNYAAIVEAMRAGCAAGVFALQWHGLEHCWPASILARARRDEALRQWLADPAARSEALPSELQSRWVDAADLPSRPHARADIEAAVAEEASLLREVFGSVPGVAVPNTFVWNDAVERAWIAAGVSCIVTPGRRFEGRDAKGGLQAPTRILRNGDRSAVGAAIYVVRDDYFEPIRGHRAEQVWDAVDRKAALGRPTLLETHRESFVASTETRRGALQEIERALRGVLDRHPNARFLATARLAALFREPGAELREQRFHVRLGVFVLRLQSDAEFARFLKFSGLKLPLWGLARLAQGVTHGRFLAASQ